MAQGISPIPPDKQFLTAVLQTSPIPPDEQPTTVVQQISPVQPASPVPPYEQLHKILQPASPLPVKSSHLEEIITNIRQKKSDDYFEKQFCQNLILKLDRDLKSEKIETAEHIKDYFSGSLDNMNSLSWISNKLGYKSNHMKKVFEEKAYNEQRLFHPTSNLSRHLQNLAE